jgi:hypothetical protein
LNSRALRSHFLIFSEGITSRFSSRRPLLSFDL